MKYQQIFTSILDNDFYKITMQCAVVKLYPEAVVKYRFFNRGNHQFPEGFAEALTEQIQAMSQLALTKEEKSFLTVACPYLNPAYIDFLEGYRYDPSEVSVVQDGGDLSVEVEGLWYRTILWEVPLLSLISELKYKVTGEERWSDEKIVKNTTEKTDLFKSLGIRFAEFGTRRRHSRAVHELVSKTLNSTGAKSYMGSSNVYLAMKEGRRPIGTHAHEWFMYHAAEFGFKMANRRALDGWVDVFRGDLGVALSDTYTTEVFFRQFDKKLAKLFDGVRHDSGDPVEFSKKTIAHYEKLGINPHYKFIIFSDGLNPDKVESITEATKGKIGISFGIGTNLTNDVGLRPMNIVMKLTDVMSNDGTWTPAVKLSDEHGKTTGDARMVALAQEILKINT